MPPTLVILHHGKATRFALPPEGATIGRVAPCEIVLDDARISRRHARFLPTERGVEVEDLGSHNGTLVVGQAAAHGGETVSLGGHQLVPGARVVLGPTTIVQIGSAVVAVEQPPSLEATDAVIVDPAMHALYGLAERVAASGLGVILRGETGVGKEVLAQFLHRRSPRATARMLAINCAAVSESLIEAELFGYEKGAFTGATQTTPGLLEAADKGTMFLDEVGELPLAAQAKLLRVIETGELLRIGRRTVITIDVRYIAATHRDLAAEVAAGRFREDLYYRLNGITLDIPPLRDRGHEIAPLAERFASATTPVALAPDALARLLAHDWPGNVRELRNVIRRAVVLSGGPVIRAEHVVLEERVAATERASPEALRARAEELERQRIVEALEACGGNQTRTAERLGLTRRALIVRLSKYGLPRPRRSQGPWQD